MASKSKIEIILSAKDTGLTAALLKARAQTAAFASAMRSAASPMTSLVSSALSLKSALAGVVAGAGLSALGKSLIDAGKGMDSLKLSYTAIAGSSQGAAREMEFVRSTADALGMDLLTTAAAYKQLAAASMGTSLAGKQTQAIFTSVAKASTTLGLSADETSGALMAISQMISKGKVSAEELRGQLGERLPGAFQIAASAMGMTTAELDKAMSNGEVYADVFLPKFAAALEQRFGGAAANAANTFGAASNRIASQLDLLKAAMGQAVTNNNFFVTALKDAGGALQRLAGDAENNGAKWREWAKQAGLSVLDAASAILTGANSIYRAFEAVNGAVNRSIAYIYQLKVAYLEGAIAGKLFSDSMKETVGIKSDGSLDKLTAEYEAAKKKADEFSQAAEKNWRSMSEGSGALESAAKNLQAYREKMEKVSSSEAIGAQAQKTTEKIVKIGDTWTNVSAAINKETIKPQIEIEQEAYKKSLEVLREAVKNQADNAEEVHKKAASGASGSWEDAAGAFESSWSKSIEQIARRLDSLKDKSRSFSGTGASGSFSQGGEVRAYQLGGQIQALATGGGVRNILAGGRLPGFGGGDRRLLLGEDGEVMLRKESVKAAGLRAALAFNAGRFDIVLAELSKRMKTNIGYRLGGLIDRLPQIPQRLAAGGPVAATGDLANFGTINLNLGNGVSAPMVTTRESARNLMRELTRMQQRSSR